MSIDFRDKITAERLYEEKRNKRFKASTNEHVLELLKKFESDRGRIIQSAAIRRLQQKTQVFPLERNAAVRSRLTHSLEVQQTGRFIVRTIFEKLSEEEAASYGLGGRMDRALETLVEMSCLMHDIGNPPFGHFGEAAITTWFEEQLPTLFQKFEKPGFDTPESQHLNLLKRDLAAFEGNAQALRLTAQLLKLNLTYTQSAGLLKYTRPAYESRPKGSYRQKKPGFYYSEQHIVDQLQSALKIAPGCRHPIVYIMEAADDISYCLADIEDAVEKGILTVPQLMDLLESKFVELCAAANIDAETTQIESDYGKKTFTELMTKARRGLDYQQTDPIGQFFINLRVELIHPLVRHAALQFLANIETTYDGTLDRALLEDNSVYEIIMNTMKHVAIENVFNHPEVETLELQGYQIISGLLTFYKPLLQLSREDFVSVLKGRGKSFILERRLIKRLAAKHIATYERATREPNEVEELYFRCRLLQDFISGMTDQYAFDEYQTLLASR